MPTCDPADGAGYAEAAALGPGTTSPMRLNAGSGAYAFRCLFEDTGAITGPAVTVGGHARGTPAIVPVMRNDFGRHRTCPVAHRHRRAVRPAGRVRIMGAVTDS